MTILDLAAIRAREQAATPGPWAADPKTASWDAIVAVLGEAFVVNLAGCSTGDYAATDDAAFIAHARQDVPALLDAVQRRDDALDAVLALCAEWEAGGDDWTPVVVRAAITAHLPATTTTEETRDAERERWKSEVDRALRERDALAASHREWEQRARTAEAEMRGMERGREAILAENARLRAAFPGCHAHRDGECHWTGCPQLRDGEPKASGRHCPLDTEETQ